MEKLNMFKKTTWFFLFFASIILIIIAFIYFVIAKSYQTSNSPYYKVSNKHYSDITTITQKERWEQPGIINFLAKNKITANFTGKTDNLGIIAIPFDTHDKSINDKIIFRLKVAGEKDWYYQGTYNTNQFQSNSPFPFGLPPIKHSKNILYTFEIESLSGTAKNFVSISNINRYFLTKYKFSKSELIKDPHLLLQFFVIKLNEQLSLLTPVEIMTIFLFSISPLFILMILTATRQQGVGIKTFIKTLFKKYRMELFYGERVEIKERDCKNVLFGFMITFSIVAFIVLLTGAWSSPLTGQRKWIPYLSILIPSLALSLNYLKIEWLNKGYFLVIAGFLSSVVVALGFLSYDRLSWLGVSGVLIFVCCLAIIPLMRYFSFIFAVTFMYLFGINSLVFINTYGWLGFIWTASIMSVVIFAFLFSLFYMNRFREWIIINKIIFVVLLIISSLLAFRSDTLFLGSSEFHWNYFTGVIQTIRSGGQLLWSAPSQYGLLNLLLPSFLPWTSRNSFFIFQSVLFFTSTLFIIKTIYMCFKRSAAFILLSLTSLSLFYFADPEIIGPTLFPSSSAVRFFMVYILVYTILLDYKKGSILNCRIKWFVTGAYIFGALWSAESFLYSTAIFTIYLFCSAISISKIKAKTNSAFRFLFINILTALIAFIVFNISYLAKTNHFPDWSMFFMYAFNYASGFGELSISPWGIHWAVIIVLSGIVFVLWRLYSTKKYSEWIVISVCFIALWALASYYVGRAVTNNLTAILPLIFYIFIVMLAVLINSRFVIYRLLLTSVFLPWIVVGVIGGVGNPQFIEKLQNFKYAQNINSKSFQPDKELTGILETLSVSKGTRIVYYGDLYSNPVIPVGNRGYMDPVVGMPMPLSLLEEPISENKRDIIVDRFLSKLNESVFLIHNKNEKKERFLIWKKFLGKKYFLKKMKFVSEKYEVFLIRP